MVTLLTIIAVVAVGVVLFYAFRDTNKDGNITVTEVKDNIKDTLDVNQDGKIDLADAVMAATTVKDTAKDAASAAVKSVAGSTKTNMTRAKNRRKKKSAN